MTASIRTLVPRCLLNRYRRFQRYRDDQKNLTRSLEQIFTGIYAENKWGGRKGEFHSGTGSTEDRIVNAYVSMVAAKAAHENFADLAFVDLGCGDFRVGKLLLPLCSTYVGVDIVKPIIEFNQLGHGDKKTRFEHLNIVEDQLPIGDVCFVRQVLQHLSNSQISAVIRKLARYRWVFITEHYPTDNEAIRPNVDKVPGEHIRVYENSGVYLAEPPFSLPREKLDLVMEVPGSDLGDGNDAGVIRTFLYRPAR